MMLTVNTKISTDAYNPNLNPYAQKSQELSDKEKAELERLKERDKEVKQHEEAHKRAAGTLLSVGPTYEYTIGPDGKKYAVSGDVQIDIAEVKGNPEATINKARQIRRAALAPENPSPQDKRIAAKATEMELKAQRELNESRVNKNTDTNNNTAELQSSAELSSDVKDIITYDSKGNVVTEADLSSSDLDITI